MLRTYEGYIENGQVHPFDIPAGIIGRRRAIITILDEPITIKTTAENEHAKAWKEFLNGIKKIKDEPIPELERVKFREVDI